MSAIASPAMLCAAAFARNVSMLEVFARLVSIAVPTNAIITDIIRIAIGMTAISDDPLWRSLRLMWSRPMLMRQVICPPFPVPSLVGGA